MQTVRAIDKQKCKRELETLQREIKASLLSVQDQGDQLVFEGSFGSCTIARHWILFEQDDDSLGAGYHLKPFEIEFTTPEEIHLPAGFTAWTPKSARISHLYFRINQLILVFKNWFDHYVVLPSEMRKVHAWFGFPTAKFSVLAEWRLARAALPRFALADETLTITVGNETMICTKEGCKRLDPPWFWSSSLVWKNWKDSYHVAYHRGSCLVDVQPFCLHLLEHVYNYRDLADELNKELWEGEKPPPRRGGGLFQLIANGW